MTKHALSIFIGAALAWSCLTNRGIAAPAGSEAAPASQPAALGIRLLPEVQAIGKMDAPGAQEFSGTLAATVQKHGITLPDDLLKLTASVIPPTATAPAPGLPKLTPEQITAWNDGPAANLLADVITAQDYKTTPAEMSLTLDLLEGFCRSGPTMALRLQAAARLLVLAGAEARPDKREAAAVLAGDPKRAVELAVAVINESVAAIGDGRDIVTFGSPVAMTFASVVVGTVQVDMLTQNEPTSDSMEKCRKQWEDQIGGWKKRKNRAIAQLLSESDKWLEQERLRRWTNSVLATREVKAMVEAFFQAAQKRDAKALAALMTTSGANMVTSRNMDEWIQQLIAVRGPLGQVHGFRLVSIGTPRSDVNGGGGAVICVVVWTDAQGQEHVTNPQLPYIRTDMGFRFGETP